MFKCILDTEIVVEKTAPFFQKSYYELLNDNKTFFDTTITDVDDVMMLRLMSISPVDFIAKTNFLQGNADDLAKHLRRLADLISSKSSHETMWYYLTKNDFADDLLCVFLPRIEWRQFYYYWNIDQPNLMKGLRLCCEHDPDLLNYLIFYHPRAQKALTFVDIIIDNDMVSFTRRGLNGTPLMCALLSSHKSTLKLMNKSKLTQTDSNGQSILKIFCSTAYSSTQENFMEITTKLIENTNSLRELSSIIQKLSSDRDLGFYNRLVEKHNALIPDRKR